MNPCVRGGPDGYHIYVWVIWEKGVSARATYTYGVGDLPYWREGYGVLVGEVRCYQ